MLRPIVCLMLLWAATLPAFADPVVEGGVHYVLPNDLRTIPVTVSGGELVEGINFYVQLADGGPINGGTVTAPKIAAIDLVGPGTLFSQSNTGSHAMCLPDSGGTYLIWGDWITTQPPDGKIPAAGTLAYITLDTSGAAASDVPYALSFVNVAANYAPPGFNTDFAGVAAIIHSGSIIITDLRDLTWNAGRDGNWAETAWDGLVPGYLACPNYTSRAIVDTPCKVLVSSAQEANQLTLSDGGQVAVGETDALAITTTVNVQTGGVLSLAAGAGLTAAGINLSGGTISGSGAVTPPVLLADGILDAPLPSDSLTLLNTFNGTGELQKTGLGSVTLLGNVAFTGLTLIQAGTLRIEGSVSSFEDISGAGNLQVGGSAPCVLMAHSIAVYALTIGGAASFSQHPSDDPSSVPEPSTIVLAIGAGLGFLSFFGHRCYRMSENYARSRCFIRLRCGVLR